MKRNLMLGIILLLVITLSVGCSTKPQSLPGNGNLSLSIKIPPGPSVYPQIPDMNDKTRSVRAREIPAGTTYIDVYVSNASFSDCFTVTTTPGTYTYNANFTVPVGTDYLIEVIACDNYNVALVAGKMNNVAVQNSSSTPITIELRRLNFEVTDYLPASAITGQELNFVGNLTFPINIDFDYVSDIGAFWYNPNNYDEYFVLYNPLDNANNFLPDVPRSVEFTGFAPTVSNTTRFNCYLIALGYYHPISDTDYLFVYDSNSAIIDWVDILGGEGEISLTIQNNKKAKK